MCLPLTPYKIESEFVHAGLKCVVVMAREASHRCGYVRVPEGHPVHGWDYDRADVDVHGGLTFAEIEPCVEEDGKGWWFGFDCAHAWDAMYDPTVKLEDIQDEVTRETCTIHRRFSFSTKTEHYWTQAEVEAETRNLAEQLANISKNK
jgi:hypothetical protein